MGVPWAISISASSWSWPVVLQLLSNLKAPVPSLRPRRWQGTRTAQLPLQEGSPFSSGGSPSLDVVRKLRLFRSPWFGCFYSCSCRLQWSCSAVFSPGSYKMEKGGVTWVRVFLECVNLTLDLGQRVVPAEVHLPRSAAGGFSAPAAPPTGWGHLQGETSQGVGCPSTRQGKARWEAGPGARQTEGSNSPLIVKSRRDTPWKY